MSTTGRGRSVNEYHYVLVHRPSRGVGKSVLCHAMEQTFATKVGATLEDGNRDCLVPIASGVREALKTGQLPVEVEGRSARFGSAFAHFGCTFGALYISNNV